MNSQEIIKILVDNYPLESICEGDWTETIEKSPERDREDLPWQERQKLILTRLGLGEVEKVDEYGGEGQGEKYYSVHHFKDHNVYIKINGYYQSHYGVEFNNPPYEVFPKQITKTIYE